jgi:alkylhydroperoxidase family enzyme
MAAIAEHPDGAALSQEDRAVYVFATKVATDAAGIDQADVDALRAVGLSDADVADVVFAAAARSFFTAVLDGLGAQLDEQTAQTFSPALLQSMVVGRPVAVSPASGGSAG